MTSGHRHVLIVGNGKDLPRRMHSVATPPDTTLFVGTSGLRRVRDPELHERIVAVGSREVAAWVEMARAIHAVRPFTRMANFSEREQLRAAAIGEALGLPMHSVDTVRAVHDKRLMRARLGAAGLPGPAWAGVQSAPDVREFGSRHGYPVVVKPVDGSGSSGVTVVDGPSGADPAMEWAATSGAREVMVEQFLVGPEYSVEIFSEGGRRHVAAIVEKASEAYHRVEHAHVVPAPLGEELAAEVVDMVTRALDALGADDGPTHTEVILTAAGPRIVETHLRPAGGHIPELVREAYGLDLEGLIARQAAGEAMAEACARAFGFASRAWRAAAVLYLAAPTDGRLVRVDGLADAREAPGVGSVTVEVSAGEPVRARPSDSTQRAVSIRATGPDGPAALARAQAAGARLTIIVDPISSAS